MAIFISHAHVDKGLAESLKSLFEGITSGSIVVWHSSETRPTGGVDLGDWRKQIWKRIEEAKTILVLLTPQSNDRPWLVWESGFAEGNKKHVVPVIFWHPREKIHSVFRDRQSFRGDKAESIADLCGRIIKVESGRAPSEDLREMWMPAVEQFLEKVKLEHQESDERTLFHDHFHNHDTSEKMTGRWVARWTGIKADGTENFFEADTLRVWTDETRLRMVGDGAKGKPYPMEGVVSSLGQVALSYWSEGDTAICGTVLMRPVGASIGSRLVGSWQGFTAPDLESDISYTRGRVAMAKDKGGGKAKAWVEKILESPFSGMH
ncbi:MAG: toll/interleukin-1 receptor domain-containing protein [Planctomycetota bacterium]